MFPPYRQVFSIGDRHSRLVLDLYSVLQRELRAVVQRGLHLQLHDIVGLQRELRAVVQRELRAVVQRGLHLQLHDIVGLQREPVLSSTLYKPRNTPI